MQRFEIRHCSQVEQSACKRHRQPRSVFAAAVEVKRPLCLGSCIGLHWPPALVCKRLRKSSRNTSPQCRTLRNKLSSVRMQNSKKSSKTPSKTSIMSSTTLSSIFHSRRCRRTSRTSSTALGSAFHGRRCRGRRQAQPPLSSVDIVWTLTTTISALGVSPIA